MHHSKQHGTRRQGWEALRDTLFQKVSRYLKASKLLRHTRQRSLVTTPYCDQARLMMDNHPTLEGNPEPEPDLPSFRSAITMQEQQDFAHAIYGG